MATITVQAGSALHLLGSHDNGRVSRDDNLRAALTAIRETSKAALGEMRTTLGQLRTGAHAEPADARAGLDRLPALRDAVTAAGAPVTVSVEGEERPLPTAVDHTAYRIVQESLTNVLRHAGADGPGHRLPALRARDAGHPGDRRRRGPRARGGWRWSGPARRPRAHRDG